MLIPTRANIDRIRNQVREVTLVGRNAIAQATHEFIQNRNVFERIRTQLYGISDRLFAFLRNIPGLTWSFLGGSTIIICVGTMLRIFTFTFNLASNEGLQGVFALLIRIFQGLGKTVVPTSDPSIRALFFKFLQDVLNK